MQGSGADASDAMVKAFLRRKGEADFEGGRVRRQELVSSMRGRGEASKQGADSERETGRGESSHGGSEGVAGRRMEELSLQGRGARAAWRRKQQPRDGKSGHRLADEVRPPHRGEGAAAARRNGSGRRLADKGAVVVRTMGGIAGDKG